MAAIATLSAHKGVAWRCRLRRLFTLERYNSGFAARVLFAYPRYFSGLRLTHSEIRRRARRRCSSGVAAYLADWSDDLQGLQRFLMAPAPLVLNADICLSIPHLVHFILGCPCRCTPLTLSARQRHAPA